MTVPQLAEAIRRARDFPGEQLEVVLVARALACPRCGGDRTSVLPGAESREFAARRCARCGTGFRVVVASSADLVVAVVAAGGVAVQPAAVVASPAHVDDLVPAELRPTAAQRLADERELERALELTAGDLAEAARALQGWRVRLATVRTRKLLDDELDPRPEDIELLARAVLGGEGGGFAPAAGCERGAAAAPRRVG
ncbi:MAG: hypothetical protein JNL08_05825 [Planctomycetes bacterium]|nr:hypothetical protein [Planctomycetota bacterium]